MEALVAVRLVLIVDCAEPVLVIEPSDMLAEFVTVVGAVVQAKPTCAVGPLVSLFRLLDITA